MLPRENIHKLSIWEFEFKSCLSRLFNFLYFLASVFTPLFKSVLKMCRWIVNTLLHTKVISNHTFHVNNFMWLRVQFSRLNVSHNNHLNHFQSYPQQFGLMDADSVWFMVWLTPTHDFHFCAKINTNTYKAHHHPKSALPCPFSALLIVFPADKNKNNTETTLSDLRCSIADTKKTTTTMRHVKNMLL